MSGVPQLLAEAPQRKAPVPNEPPPLEGGPPPLEEDGPAPAPPGLVAKPKGGALTSMPPPLEPATSLPRLAPPATLAAVNGAGSAASGPAGGAQSAPDSASNDDICAAMVDYLKKKPGNKDLLTRLGLYLRSRKLAPELGLKKFIQQHCQGRVVVSDSKGGTDMAQLAHAAAAEKAAAERAGKLAAAPEEAPQRPASATPSGDSFDPSWLEQRLMQQCVQMRHSGIPPTMPALGEFCIKKLGLQMKGKLKPFLEQRPQLCSISDDGRQHVLLTPAGAILGGGSASDSATVDDVPSAPLEGIAGGTLPAGSSGDASTAQVAAAVMPGVAAAQSQARDYKKWDTLTKEIYHFVRERGVATFAQIDAHIKAHAAKHIAATGVPLGQWRSQFFLHKRRNIFRLQGPVVSLGSHIPHAPDTADNEPLAAVPSSSDFPALPSPNGASAAAAPAGGASGSQAPTARPAGDNPLLAAFASERNLLEGLRDDVESKLASFKALSELQKENAGLRAACVTLGRELLTLKTEFVAFKQAATAALAGISPAAASMLTNGIGALSEAPSPVMAPVGAAEAAMAQPAAHQTAALEAAAQQQQQQQGAYHSSTQNYVASGSVGYSAAAAAPGYSTAGDAAAAEVPSLASSPAALLHGEIVLVGGHDGGSWLDSVDSFRPGEGVWASLPLLGQPRSFSAAVGTASEVFVAGGGNGADWFDSVLRYDRRAGLAGGWAQLAPLAVARGSLAAGVARGYLFTFGGGKPKEQYNVVEWYDPQSNRWLPGPPLTRKRFALGGASLDGALYAVGGYDGAAYLQCAERLDPRTDRWEELPGAMASRRGGHAVAAAGGLLFALGGFDSAQAVPHCEVFDPRMSAWRAIADMSDARAYGSCAVLGGAVFAVGGLQSDMQTHAVLIERYNPGADTWEHVELPANANPRRSFLAACGLE